MTTAKWYFPPQRRDDKLTGTTDYSEIFASDLTTSLMREICQNSLDAARRGNKKSSPANAVPVRVEFKFQQIRKADFSEIFNSALDFIKGAEDFQKKQEEAGSENRADREFLKDARAALSQKEIPILLIRDFGTPGLDGIKNDDETDKPEETTDWTKLVDSHGLSYKKSGSGGSKGVGKAAAWACSRAKMVFYATRSRDGVGFQGCFRLLPLYDPHDKARKLKNVGDFCLVSEETDAAGAKLEPISDPHDCAFFEKFRRPEGEENFGTDVIVIAVKDSVKNSAKTKLPAAAILNFFPAIVRERLVVEIEDEMGEKIEISAETLDERLKRLISDKTAQKESAKQRAKNRLEKEISELQKTQEMIAAMGRAEAHDEISVRNKGKELGIAEIWHAPSETQFDNNILYTRAAGMKIQEKSVGLGLRGFVAVVRVKEGPPREAPHEESLEELLRGAEPAEHNRWSGRGKSAAVKEAVNAIFSCTEQFLREKYRNDETQIVGGDSGITFPRAGNAQVDAGSFDPFTSSPRVKTAGNAKPKSSTETTSNAGTNGGEGDGTPISGDKKGKTKGRGGNGRAAGGGNGGNFGVRPSSLDVRIFGTGRVADGVFCVVVKARRDVKNASLRFHLEVESGKRDDALSFLESPSENFEGTHAVKSTAKFSLQTGATKKFFVKFQPCHGVRFRDCAIAVDVLTERKPRKHASENASKGTAEQ